LSFLSASKGLLSSPESVFSLVSSSSLISEPESDSKSICYEWGEEKKNRKKLEIGSI